MTELHKIGKVFVTGVALPSGMKPYIANGASKSFVLWDPGKLGYLTVWAGMQLAMGKSFQRFQRRARARAKLAMTRARRCCC